MNHHMAANLTVMCLRLLPAFLLAVLGFADFGRVLLGQDSGPRDAGRRDARAGEMKQIVGSLSATRGEGAEKRPVGLRGDPLLRWNDPTRNSSDASLWAWGETDRPLAIVTLEVYPGPIDKPVRSPRAFEFISLASESLKVQGDYGSNAKDITKSNHLLNASISWAPAKPCGTFREIPAHRHPPRHLDCGSPR